jgi:hypothetical protein
MPQYEHYEIWIRDGDDWTLKSCWREVDVGLAAARSLTRPVRIIRVVSDGNTAVERQVVAELGTTRKEQHRGHAE